MPRRNIRKIYLPGGIYHVYNRGVEKRIIFQDNQDYGVFLRFLKDSLLPPSDQKKEKSHLTLQGQTLKGVSRRSKNFYRKIELLAYCLMPNHFHFLLKQADQKDIHHFIQSLATRYSMYFNKKYKRVGTLFQSAYKAVLVMEEPYLLHLSRYIHLNPQEHAPDLVNTYSSYADYIGKRHSPWLNTKLILSSFGSSLSHILNTHSYRDFVEKWQGNSEEVLGRITLEDTLERNSL